MKWLYLFLAGTPTRGLDTFHANHRRQDNLG